MISDRVKAKLWQTFRESFLPKLGLALIVVILLLAVFAPILATHDPTQTGFAPEVGGQYPPFGLESTVSTPGPDGGITEETITWNSEHLLGTNNANQDVYSRFLYGARVSLIVGVAGVALALIIGVPIGLVAGYYGGRVDSALMRSADIMLAFPSLVLALAVIGAFGNQTVQVPDPLVLLFSEQAQIGLPVVDAAVPLPEVIVNISFLSGMPETIPAPGAVILVVALVTWVWFARVARGEALAIKNEEYVKAAQSFGESNWTVLRRHVLPNAVTPIIVLATIQIAVIILTEASLSYLGFSGTTLSWGYEIQQGQDILRERPWVAVVPGIGIVASVISVNLLGDWLRDALDPNIDAGERGG